MISERWKLGMVKFGHIKGSNDDREELTELLISVPSYICETVVKISLSLERRKMVS